MPLSVKARSFLRNLFLSRGVEVDLDEEVHSHLEMLVEENIRAGMPAEEAQRAARIELGGIEQVKEQVREGRIGNWLLSVISDCGYGVRQLRKNPGFTAVAVLTLALGIGANAAIFGLVDAALLRGLPFREPDRLVHIWTTDATGDLHTPTTEQYSAVLKNGESFEQIAAAGWADEFYGSNESNWQNLPGFLVSSNWLPTLGIQPLLGRNFRNDEEKAGQDAVVMLSYSCWRERFHGDPSVVGKQIVINRRTVTIVGVLPQGLGPYDEGVEIYAPLVLSSYAKTGNIRAGVIRAQIAARLKPGIPLDQARSEMEVIAQQFRPPGNPGDPSGHLLIEEFAKDFRHPGPTMQNARRGLWMMAAAAGLVLLIASANVASLLLARGVKRHREVAVRTYLGCSRGRMIRQLLTETTLLFLCGGSLGLLVARWSQAMITKVASGMVPNGAYLQIDVRVFTLGLGLSFLSALVFGIAPALHLTRMHLNDTLKDAAPNAGGGLHSRRSRNLLVVFQIAVGMALLVAFGLLFRSLSRVESAAMGFDPHNVLTASVRLPPSPYADLLARARLTREVVDRLRLMPGVESAGITDSLPMEGADSAGLKIEVTSAKGGTVEEVIWFLSVDPEYFSTLKVPMLAGRRFHDSDSRESGPVVIVNRSFVEHFFPAANPLGYHVAFAGYPTTWKEIVGVVSDFKQRNPEEDSRPLVYFPLAQTLPEGRLSVAIRVRSPGDNATIARSLTDWLRPLDPQLYWVLGNMQQQIHDSESLTLRRPIIRLLAYFAVLALVLATVGVFGVTSYSVAERTREIGIRIALGADRGEISSLVLRETLMITLAGLAGGSLMALVLTQFFSTGPIGWSGSGIFLYGVSRTDTLTFTYAAVLLAMTALTAAYLPTRHATRADPMIALRNE